MVEVVATVATNLKTEESADDCMARLSTLVSSWATLEVAAALLEKHQRASGFTHVLTAAEMRQLCPLTQRYAAVVLAGNADRAQAHQQAVALRRTALAASRQLCALQSGSAAYLLHLAKDTTAASAVGSSVTRQELKAFQTALEAATEEKGAARTICKALPSHHVGNVKT
jgi:hypothetical protein